MHFENLNLIPQVLDALKDQGYEKPTPIQAQAIPHLLQGRDLFGSAQTGTGKTAAFSIPILQLLSNKNQNGHRSIRALVLAPTRELAVQISESLRVYGRHLQLRHTVVYGGVPQRQQTEALRRGVDILVATPGRLLDLIEQGYIRLNSVEILVLDEADRMLDMGFINDIRKVIAMLPQKRQTVLFSATLPQEIRSLMAKSLHDPVHIELSQPNSSAENVEHSMYFVDRLHKRDLLEHVLNSADVQSALVFTRTKHGADKLAIALSKSGIRTEAIHGNKSQGARQRALNEFKRKKVRVLIATDVASRGIDVDDLSHVINFDLPETPEVYVHRIGRTGRAGAKGIALSFCGRDEMHLLRDIHKLLRTTIPVIVEHPYATQQPVKPAQTERRLDERRPQSFSGNKFRSQFRRKRDNSGSFRENSNRRFERNS